MTPCTLDNDMTHNLPARARNIDELFLKEKRVINNLNEVHLGPKSFQTVGKQMPNSEFNTTNDQTQSTYRYG